LLAKLIEWITACWGCEPNGWFELACNVLSCTLRALIVIALMYAAYTWSADLVNAI